MLHPCSSISISWNAHRTQGRKSAGRMCVCLCVCVSLCVCLCVCISVLELLKSRAGSSSSSTSSRPVLFSTAEGRVGLPWPGTPPCRLGSVLPAPGTLPAHAALLWESENGAPSRNRAPPPSAKRRQIWSLQSSEGGVFCRHPCPLPSFLHFSPRHPPAGLQSLG